MKHSMIRLLTVSLSVLAMCLFAGSVFAQGKGGGKGGGGNDGGDDPPPNAGVGYRIHWVFGPEEANDISTTSIALKLNADRVATTAYATGYYLRNDRQRASAYIYIMTNPGVPGDQTANRFWDIEELVGPTPAGIPWATDETPISSFLSNFHDVNADGLVSGYVMDPDGNRRGVYLDLNAETPELRLIPEPPHALARYDQLEGYRVSSTGNIVVSFQTRLQTDGNRYREAAVFTPSTGELRMIEDSTTNQPIQFKQGREFIQMGLNEVIGTRAIDEVVIRYSLETGQYAAVPGVLIGGRHSINEGGQFTAEAIHSTSKNGRRTYYQAVRIGADNSTEWTSVENGGQLSFSAGTINNQGDVLYHPTSSSVVYFSESNQLESTIDDLIIAESDPLGWYIGGNSSFHSLTDADDTGFGWVAPFSNESGGIAILIPEALP